MATRKKHAKNKLRYAERNAIIRVIKMSIMRITIDRAAMINAACVFLIIQINEITLNEIFIHSSIRFKINSR